MTIQSIQTKYDYRYFRSRTEARWAVFFNSLKLKYDYEKEGYALLNGWYLPDFYIHELDCFIEIKGQEPKEIEHNLCHDLAAEINKDVYLFIGNPRIPELGNINSISYNYSGYEMWDYDHWFCQCPVCKKIGIAYCGRSERICECINERQFNYDTNDLINAVQNALEERFCYA